MSRALPDFDAGALCKEVLLQDIGLSIQTNDPATFKRRMYEHMARTPEHKLSIFVSKHSPTTLLLVKQQALPNGQN